MIKKKKEKSISDKLKQARDQSLKQLIHDADQLKSDATMESLINLQLLTSLSHNLKTPLNSILSSTTLLKNRSLDNKSYELLNIIDQNGHYLFSLMNSVLDLYGLLFNQINITHHLFNFQDELEEVQFIFSENAHVRGVRIFFNISPTIPHFVRGDAPRMKQILIYLLDNALQSSPSGEITVNAECIENKSDSMIIGFKITGNGIEISESDTIKMQQIMFSGNFHPGLTPSQIGLVLSVKLCHLLGGKMNLERKEGLGSFFSFTIRMEKVSELTDRSTNIRRILLVEDNLINQRLTRLMLENHGYEVEVANNGKIAVEKFQISAFDLILMDLQMPVMDGLEATRKIRKIEKHHGYKAKVLIIALTANSQLQEYESCIAAGMNDFISKPFAMDKLPLLIQNLELHKLSTQ